MTVNTLEAIYGQENSFGILLGTRGSSGAAGHFQFRAKTTREYGLHVSKDNDQRFDIGYVASAAARYLKDADAGIRENVPRYEVEFAEKSSADKNVKHENPRTGQYDCTEGHWVTIDDHPVFICA